MRTILYIVHNITILYLILLYLMYNIIIKLIFTGEKHYDYWGSN